MDWQDAMKLAEKAADVAIRCYGCSKADWREIANDGALYIIEYCGRHHDITERRAFNLVLLKARVSKSRKHAKPDTREIRYSEPKRIIEILDLLDTLADLSDEDIRLLRLIFVDDLPKLEIAKEINRSIRTVQYRTTALLDRLRERLGVRQGDPK